MKSKTSGKRYLSLHPVVLALACINIILDGKSRIGMNLDGVYKFFNAINFNINDTYNVQTYLFNTPFDYTSRNFAEFIKGIPIWVSYNLGFTDFHTLTYIWSLGLSLINWSLLIATLYLLEKHFQPLYFYLMGMIMSVYAITLTSYLDSTLNFAIFITTLLYVLSKDEESKTWKLLLFFMMSILAISIHEVLLPLIGILNCVLIFQVIQSSKAGLSRLLLFRIFRMLASNISILFLLRHFLKNRNVYTTVGEALTPNFLIFERYGTHPRSILLIIALTILALVRFLPKKKFVSRRFFLVSITSLISTIPLVVTLDYIYQNLIPRRPFLEYQYRPDYSVLVIIFFAFLLSVSTISPKFGSKFGQIQLKNLVQFSLTLILISSSATHILGNLNWSRCWNENVGNYSSRTLTKNDEITLTCNTAGWTTLMTSIVYSNSSKPKNFIINKSDLVKESEDTSLVQKSGNVVFFPFGLEFPVTSPGLDLSLLPDSR
jgi:hypothetical protein